MIHDILRRTAGFFLITLISISVFAHPHGVLDANKASKEQMARLPQISAELADAVIAARPFATVGELDKLLAEGLSEEEREALYGRLFVPLNLNSAADADIQLIPGVGRRMAHEFEEYRPYTNIEQFRREIGKYVDEAEVARLEQYVTLE